ncbi:unnamed protein product, partial [Rotaria sp. Silwood1]
YGVTIMINVFPIIHSASRILYFNRIPLWKNFIITISVDLIIILSVMIFVKPCLKKVWKVK